jgi:hypothetical protein
MVMDEEQRHLDMARRFAAVLGKTLHVYTEYRGGRRCYVFASEGSPTHRQAESRRLTRIATY